MLEPECIPVTNWTSLWSDGIALYTLVSLLRPAELPLAECPAGRELKAFTACDALSIPLCATFGDIASARPNATVTRMQVQAVFGAIGAGALPHRVIRPSQSAPVRPATPRKAFPPPGESATPRAVALGIDEGAVRGLRGGRWNGGRFVSRRPRRERGGRAVERGRAESAAAGRNFRDPAGADVVRTDRRTAVQSTWGTEGSR
jgi:hypothetical protein